MSGKSSCVAGAVLAGAFVAVTVLAVQEQIARRALGEPLAALPAFRLIDQTGQPVTLETFGGRPWVVDFIFTRCGGQCPLLTQRMKKLAGMLPKGVRLVSLSVDPEYDRPEILAAYAQERGAVDPRWSFLTGNPDDVRALIRAGFLLALEPGQPDSQEPILHSTRFVLVDGRGQVRRYAEAFDDAALESLARDAGRLR